MPGGGTISISTQNRSIDSSVIGEEGIKGSGLGMNEEYD